MAKKSHWDGASKQTAPKRGGLPMPARATSPTGEPATPLEAMQAGMGEGNGEGGEQRAGAGMVEPGQNEQNAPEQAAGEPEGGGRRGGGGGFDIDALAEAIVLAAAKNPDAMDLLADKLAKRLLVK